LSAGIDQHKSTYQSETQLILLTLFNANRKIRILATTVIRTVKTRYCFSDVPFVAIASAAAGKMG
jgi:hypothetical protein